MVIAPLDHLWVVADVPEKHRDQLRVGQEVEVQFPVLEQTIQGKVEYVGSEVSRDNGQVRVRAHS